MSDEDKITSFVTVHGRCGLRPDDCVCDDGPQTSMKKRIEKLESELANMKADLKGLQSQ